MPEPGALALLAVGALFIGSLIGMTGIGGVLLLPVVMAVTGAPVEIAARVCLGAYLFTGIAGSLSSPRGIADRSPLKPLLIAALTGSIFGVWVSKLLPGDMILIGLAALTLVSGTIALFADARETDAPQETLLKQLGLGGVVGFASVLTATGGPVILAPILILLRRNTRETITLSHFIQLPIGLVGLVSAALRGADVAVVAVALGIVLAVGATVGARLGRYCDDRYLKLALGVVLLFYGGFALVRNHLDG